MEINDLLNVFDRAAANLDKLEKIWQRAGPMLPSGPAAGSSAEFDDLSRAWRDLLPGLPRINGWTIIDELPDPDYIGRAFIDYAEISEIPFSVYEEKEKPDRDLAEYRFRLNRARRRAARTRLEQLMAVVDATLPQILVTLPDSSQERVEGAAIELVARTVAEVERLMGDSAARRGRWNDLHRHMRFGQPHDWQDIAEFDWPSVKSDVLAATFSESDPLPVPDLDLGEAAAGDLTGSVSTTLPWSRLDDAGFERLLFDLLRAFPDHKNVQLLMNTRAADRGRDLSFERVLQSGTGVTRSERVIVQAKHWLSRSVALPEVAANVASVALWQPPIVRGLIVATSGRFTADAVAWVEQHNEAGTLPLIELWPESTLESLLAQKPHIAAAHGLR